MCRTVVFSHSILLIAEYGPFWWLIFELFDDDTRIAYSDAVGRDVFNDYASCSDCAAFTNRHPRKNCHTASYPTVITNSHWLGPFLSCIAFFRVSAMAGSIDAYIRSNEDIIADCYRRLIKNNEIEVSKEFLADLDMFPIVTMEWRVYECVVIGLTQNPLQFLIPCLEICRPYLIVFPAQLRTCIQVLQKRRICCVINGIFLNLN